MLSPCKNCGKDPYLSENDDYIQVQCRSCGSSGPSIWYDDHPDYHELESDWDAVSDEIIIDSGQKAKEGWEKIHSVHA